MPDLAELVEYEGKVAQYRGEMVSPTEPVRYVDYVVSDLPVLDDFHDYRYLIGKVPGKLIGQTAWSGYILHDDRHIYVDTSSWRPVRLEKPIPRPRNGKEYSWKWDGNTLRWARDWFPQCETCRKYHDPAFEYCESCYRCHDPKKACKKA